MGRLDDIVLVLARRAARAGRAGAVLEPGARAAWVRLDGERGWAAFAATAAALVACTAIALALGGEAVHASAGAAPLPQVAAAPDAAARALEAAGPPAAGAEARTRRSHEQRSLSRARGAHGRASGALARAADPSRAETASASATASAAAAPQAGRAPGVASPGTRIRRVSAQEQAARLARRGAAAEARGDLRTALAAYRRALETHPGDREARLRLATLLARAGASREALAVVREGLAAAPDQPALARVGARLLAARGDEAGALALLERAAPANGTDPEHDAFRAAMLARLSRPAEAARLYQSALRARPRTARWWLGFAMSLEAQGLSGPAVRAYRTALELGELPEASRAWAQARVAGIEAGS